MKDTLRVRELDFSVAARQVRVKFVVTDVMYPVLSVAKLTEQGFDVEFGQQACMSYGHEQQRRWRLCGIAAKIWDLLDTDGQVRRKSSTVSPVTLSETVQSEGLPAINQGTWHCCAELCAAHGRRACCGRKAVDRTEGT